MGAPSPVPTRPFDFARVTVVWGAITVTVGAESVKASRDEDSFTPHVAADGTVTLAVNNNRMGKIVVVIPQNSPVHDVLSAQLSLDEINGPTMQAIRVTDGSGTTTHSAPAAWLVKPPDVEYQKEPTTREWTFACDKLTAKIGGLT